MWRTIVARRGAGQKSPLAPFAKGESETLLGTKPEMSSPLTPDPSPRRERGEKRAAESRENGKETFAPRKDTLTQGARIAWSGGAGESSEYNPLTPFAKGESQDPPGAGRKKRDAGSSCDCASSPTPVPSPRRERGEKGAAGRVVCALIPRFGLALYSKDDPHLLLDAAVLAEDGTDTALVLEVNGKAAKAGVTIGMTAAQAGMLCAGLVVKTKNPAREEEELQELLTRLQAIAPLIEVETPGVLLVAAEGFDALYGGEHPLAERIVRTIKDYGLPVRAGIGDNPFVARLAAELTRPGTVQAVAAGTARVFLAPLPVKHLPVSVEVREQLLALGIRTIGQAAEFPANELVARFGAEGALIAHLARDDDPRHFVPLALEEDLTERLILDDPYCQLPLVLDLAERAMKPLLQQLGRRGLACGRMAVRLQFADRSRQTLELAVDKPTLSLRKLRRQLQHQLEQAHVDDGVVEIAVAPLATMPLHPTQLDLAARGDTSNEERILEQQILRKSLLTVRIHAAVLPEDCYSLSRFDPHATSPPPELPLPETCSSRPAFALAGIVGLRTFNPVRRIEVISENEQPRLMIVGGQRRRIVRCHGPWQVSGRWWHDEFRRDYFEVETERGEVYLIYRVVPGAVNSAAESGGNGQATFAPRNDTLKQGVRITESVSAGKGNKYNPLAPFAKGESRASFGTGNGMSSPLTPDPSPRGEWGETSRARGIRGRESEGQIRDGACRGVAGANWYLQGVFD